MKNEEGKNRDVGTLTVHRLDLFTDPSIHPCSGGDPAYFEYTSYFLFGQGVLFSILLLETEAF